MKLNSSVTKELKNSFINSFITSLTSLFVLLVLTNITIKTCFLYQGIIWGFTFNLFYIFMGQYKEKEPRKLLFLNFMILVYIYIMVFI